MGMFGLDFADVMYESHNLGLTPEEDAMMEAYEAIPCEDDFDFAYARITLEHATNFHNLMMAVAVDEMSEIMVTHEEVIYEEGRIKAFFDKVITMIENAWKKAKGVIEKLFTTITTWALQGKQFVKKYGDKVKAYKGEAVKVKGYKYSFPGSSYEEAVYTKFVGLTGVGKLDTMFAGKGGVTKAKGVSEDDFGDKLRGAILGGSSISSSDFNKKIKAAYRSDATEATEQSYSADKGADLLKEIEGTADAIKAAKALRNETKTTFKNMITNAKRVERDFAKASELKGDEKKDHSKAIHRWTSACSQAIHILNTVYNAHIGAILGRYQQNKQAAMKMVSGASEKKAATTESALESVAFI